MPREKQEGKQSDLLDDSVDDFCYQLAVVLRRVLSLEEEGIQGDEDKDGR